MERAEYAVNAYRIPLRKPPRRRPLRIGARSWVANIKLHDAERRAQVVSSGKADRSCTEPWSLLRKRER
jgi:hypothetical protein